MCPQAQPTLQKLQLAVGTIKAAGDVANEAHIKASVLCKYAEAFVSCKAVDAKHTQSPCGSTASTLDVAEVRVEARRRRRRAY